MSKKYRASYLFFLATCGCVIFFARLDRLCFKSNGSFSPNCVLPKWEKLAPFPSSMEEMDSILTQSFSYLTKGLQSFIFVSEDGQFVLKLFRFPSDHKRFTLTFKKSQGENLITQAWRGAALASHSLRREAQLIYSHLAPSSHFHRKVHLIDQLNRSHYLDLDDLPFIVQRYGTPFFAAFDQEEDKRSLIEKTLLLFSSLYDKGFIDHDPIFDCNLGVLDHAPFLIDIGQLASSPLPSKEEYLLSMTFSLGSKLERDYPSLHTYYKNLLQSNLFDTKLILAPFEP